MRHHFPSLLSWCQRRPTEKSEQSPLPSANKATTPMEAMWGIVMRHLHLQTSFPGGSVVKNPPANAGDADSIPGLGRSPGGGNGNPLQYSCLENPTARGTWQATVHGVAKSCTWLNNWALTHAHLQTRWSQWRPSGEPELQFAPSSNKETLHLHQC